MAIVNGFSSAYSNIAITLAKGIKFDLLSVTFGESIEEAKGGVMGAYTGATRRSAGVYQADNCTFSLYNDQAEKLKASLAAMGQGAYSNVLFPITITVAEPRAAVYTTVLEECRIIKLGASWAMGPELLVQEFEASCMRVKHGNGSITMAPRFSPF